MAFFSMTAAAALLLESEGHFKKSTKGLMMVGQTGSFWLPAKSALTPSNWTFCSYMIPDEKI